MSDLGDQWYGAMVTAGGVGHAPAGLPVCECGEQFASHAELDQHRLDAAALMSLDWECEETTE